ncbi:craniofacial development protein 1 isoform X2 [Brassica rapa]|uniref:craniofacial development protein 1 isoform X2 n=1 Tax=Brassica campestris TaxID=3711 RepID=UPI0004F19C4F|nr:craniofacial development protein 1 isoform X2 [Brassica rapa]XP_033129720.1 craniofacial development protein 1 isoform X2 [Brassica rapa]
MESHNQSENQSSPEKSGSSSVSKKVAEMWERMNAGVPKKRVNFHSKSATALPAKNSANNSNCRSYLGVLKEDSVSDNSCSEEAKSIAAAALAAVRNATATAAAASSRGKVEITEVKDFAGQEIEVKRLVEAGSKEASSSASTSGVDAVLEQIKKKQKLSVLDKTKKDWGEYKEENKGVEDELDKYKKSSDQYLDKVSFLERADYRQFEKERDVRLALQSKRKHDDV